MGREYVLLQQSENKSGGVTVTQISLVTIRMSKLWQNKLSNIENNHLTCGHTVTKAE
jgi:hypothetical protein